VTLTSHLFSFLPPAPLSANSYAPGRQLPFYLLHGNTVLVLVQLCQSLPHCGNKFELLRDVAERYVVGHSAQQLVNKLLVRHS